MARNIKRGRACPPFAAVQGPRWSRCKRLMLLIRGEERCSAPRIINRRYRYFSLSSLYVFWQAAVPEVDARVYYTYVPRCPPLPPPLCVCVCVWWQPSGRCGNSSLGD